MLFLILFPQVYINAHSAFCSWCRHRNTVWGTDYLKHTTLQKVDVMSDQINQWSRVPLEKLIVGSLSMKFTAHYETLGFLGVNQIPLLVPILSNLILPMTSKPISLRSILVLFSLIFPSPPRSSIHLTPSGNRSRTLHSSVFSPMRATRPSHPIYWKTKISFLSPRGLSKLHLGLLSEMHEISLDAIIDLYFHNLKM